MTLGRGVRLRGRSSRPAAPDGRQGVRRLARRVPELNARLDGDAIVLPRPLRHRRRGADGRRPRRPGRAWREREVPRRARGRDRALAERARAGRCGADELRNSTFTVTSAGKLAGLFQTPIVNHPEVAILSVGRIAPRPVVRDGEVVVRRTGAVALTFDHRVVDGARPPPFGLGRHRPRRSPGLGRSTLPPRGELVHDRPLPRARPRSLGGHHRDPRVERPRHRRGGDRRRGPRRRDRPR